MSEAVEVTRQVEHEVNADVVVVETVAVGADVKVTLCCCHVAVVVAEGATALK